VRQTNRKPYNATENVNRKGYIYTLTLMVVQMEEIADRIVIDPDVMVGKPVIQGTRIPVYLIVEFVANGMGEAEILTEYPQLTREDIKAALLYASKCVQREVTVTL